MPGQMQVANADACICAVLVPTLVLLGNHMKVQPVAGLAWAFLLILCLHQCHLAGDRERGEEGYVGEGSLQ